MAHESSYKVLMPFGKYKGLSLGYIADAHPGYLDWLSGAESVPMIWRQAAALTLQQQAISQLGFSTAQASSKETPKAYVWTLTKDKLAVKFNYDKELLERFKLEIDGRVWNSAEKHWEFPAVHFPKLVSLFGGKKNVSPDEKAKQLFEKEIDRRAALDEIRVKEDNELKVPTIIELFPYQKVAVEFIEESGGRAMVADAMGLGKTATAIGYAVYKNFKTICVVPKSVVHNWAREIKRFAGKNTCIWESHGRTGRRDAQFHVVNYDAVDKYFKEFNELGFDLLVCDEATLLKNRNTKRAKIILGYWKERKKYPGIKTKYCLFLTGTPILNRPVEAFHLLSYLDKNRFNNFMHFVMKYGGWKTEGPKNLHDLHMRTKDLVIRRRKDDVQKELPPKQRNDLFVSLDPPDYKEYLDLLGELFTKWKASSKPTVAEMPKIQQFLLKKKMPRAIEMIDELLENDRSILIFSVYIEPLKYLLKKYNKDAVMLYGEMNLNERQKNVDLLSEGKKKIGLFSIGAGSMGINGLQNSIDTVLFLDFWWVPAIHEQAEDRVHRTGQTRPVQIFYMICENTIDEYMASLLTEKRAIAEQIVDGDILTGQNNKSFFKDFVKILQADYFKELGDLNIG